MLIDLVMTFGSLGVLGLITAIAYGVYRQEFNNRCGWCFGSGREWGQEYAPRCAACHGTGVMTVHRSPTLALATAKASPAQNQLVRDRHARNNSDTLETVLDAQGIAASPLRPVAAHQGRSTGQVAPDVAGTE